MYLNIEQPPSFASSVRLTTRRFASSVERATSRSLAATVRQCRKIKSVWSVNCHSHDETLRHFFSDFENFQSPTEWRKVKCSAKLWIKKKRNRRMRRHVVPCHCLSLFDGRRRRSAFPVTQWWVTGRIEYPLPKVSLVPNVLIARGGIRTRITERRRGKDDAAASPRLQASWDAFDLERRWSPV